MALKDLPGPQQGVQLLQRSLERGRLAHAYLFTGHQLGELETIARALAKTLNCQSVQPGTDTDAKPDEGLVRTDSCDQCPACRKIEHGNHPDVHWVRPESKTRVITIEQMRGLMQDINLKPTEGAYKVCVIVAADRMNDKAANAFLKTLEEPPASSILILLSTEPQRVLETILSRCLRLSFGGDGPQRLAPAQMEWLKRFSEMAAAEQKSLLGRYRLMDTLLQRLNELRTGIEASLKARSPLEQYKDADREFVEKWEDELAAAVEAEYRRERADLLLALQWWLRDVWVCALGVQSPESKVQSRESGDQASSLQPPASLDTQEATRHTQTSTLLNFPELAGTGRVAERVSAKDALGNLQVMEQLQRWLHTNVQEALALEVGLLKLKL